MKLNKKACRVSAASYPPLDARHGLLHTEQVCHIIRAAVKTIDHHRVLVLYVYSREQAAQGDCRPLWVMFQGKDDYITLEHDAHGTTRWRTAAFERLGDTYNFVRRCAFYSTTDRDRVTRFFHDEHREGLDVLIHAQREILEERLQERLREREKAVKRRMEHLPTLPRGLGGWLRRKVVPAYFIYAHARKGEAAGVCTACGHEVSLTGVKHNAKAVCPRCGRELTAKPGGRIGRLCDRVTVQVLQQTRTGELLVRIVKVVSTLEQGTPQIRIWENARQFLQLDADGSVRCDGYYETCDGHWKQGERPVYYRYSYNFYADTCGHLYTANLPAALAGTPWQYCPLNIFYEHFREPMETATFLSAYVRHPKLEHLVKVGFFSLASDLVYRGHSWASLDETQDRTHRLLGVGAEDVAFLRGLDVDLPTLKAFQSYCQRGLKDRQRLLMWQLGHKVERNILPVLEHMTAHKFVRYLDGQYAFLQFRQTQYKTQRYNSMQALVTEYRDYLDMCEKQHYDMTNSFILYPRDLQKAHDKVAHRIKLKADAQMRRDFKTAYQRIMGRLDFELDGMKIVYPATPDEIIAEGNSLHHCVGGYVDRVARQECMILFLRRCEDVSKPFYTVEVRNQKAVQVRGMRNADMTPEVRNFMDRWERQVLQRQEMEAA